MRTDNNFPALLADGHGFEDYVVVHLRPEGYPTIRRLLTRDEQIEHGDTNVGIEIKHDRKWKFSRRLFIEVAEWTPNGNVWMPSGIEASGDFHRYGIGDEKTFFIFDREVLRNIRSQHDEFVIEQGRGQSRGFLITEREARALNPEMHFWPKGTYAPSRADDKEEPTDVGRSTEDHTRPSIQPL